MHCVLFDLDGTLLDSAPGIYQSIRYALNKQGLPIPNEEILRLFIGPPLVDSFQKHCGQTKEESELTRALFREDYLADGKYKNGMYPGIRELLAALKARGYMLGIATAKTEDVSREILAHEELADYFDIICGANHVLGRNNKDDVLPEAMRLATAHAAEQGQTIAKFYMVGDRKYDMSAAVANGCTPVGVLYGFGTAEELREAGAAYLCETTEDVLTVITHQG